MVQKTPILKRTDSTMYIWRQKFDSSSPALTVSQTAIIQFPLSCPVISISSHFYGVSTPHTGLRRCKNSSAPSPPPTDRYTKNVP